LILAARSIAGCENEGHAAGGERVRHGIDLFAAAEIDVEDRCVQRIGQTVEAAQHLGQGSSDVHHDAAQVGEHILHHHGDQGFVFHDEKPEPLGTFDGGLAHTPDTLADSGRRI
jgi:hypothetical protein